MLDLYVRELQRIYGCEHGQEIARAFDQLAQFMTNPAASYRELVDGRHYHRGGIHQINFERRVGRAAVAQYLCDYAARLEANQMKGIAAAVAPGDIKVMLQHEIPKLGLGVQQAVGSRGRKTPHRDPYHEPSIERRYLSQHKFHR